MYYTYILKCADDSYYVGSTENLNNRVRDHNSGKGAEYTFKRKPCCLVWYNKHSDQKLAILQEKQIKKISRQKKEKLIFAKDTIWQHYKGNKYIILGQIDNLIVYSDYANWQKFVNKKEIPGEQSAAYLRHKDQWLDWADVQNKKLRFNLVA